MLSHSTCGTSVKRSKAFWTSNLVFERRKWQQGQHRISTRCVCFFTTPQMLAYFFGPIREPRIPLLLPWANASYKSWSLLLLPMECKRSRPEKRRLVTESQSHSEVETRSAGRLYAASLTKDKYQIQYKYKYVGRNGNIYLVGTRMILGLCARLY